MSELFDTLDANGDERIYYSDFLAATLEKRTDIREEALRAVFHRLDADQSGALSAEDFRTVLGETFEGVNVDEMINEAGLGKAGEISFDAFMQMLGRHDAIPAVTQPLSPPKIPRDPGEKRTVDFFDEVEIRG